MADLPSSADTRPIELTEKIKTVAAILGIASAFVGVATFIGLKPERRKLLEWEYVSKSSLINQTAPAMDKIRVLYDNRAITQLTVVTARLSNVGSIPIEGADVKDGVFPKVTFPVPVISAETKEPNRAGIKASAVFDEHSVQIQHGLLNPGDSVPIQILLEGDLGNLPDFPKVMYRVSGIHETATRYPSAVKPRIGVAYFSFNKSVEYFVLGVATLVPVLCVVLLFFGIPELMKFLFPERRLRKLEESRRFATETPQNAIGALLTMLYKNLPYPL